MTHQRVGSREPDAGTPTPLSGSSIKYFLTEKNILIKCLYSGAAAGTGERQGRTMSDQKIDIGSYAGHKDEESPRVFFVHGEKITVLKILKMWIEEAEGDRRQKRFFTLHGSDGFDHTLYYDLESGAWFYRSFEKAKRSHH